MEIAKSHKKYSSNHSLVYSCRYHVVFCPKYPRRVLINGVDERLKELILEKQTQYEYEVLDMEVMPDHVHLLLSVNPQVCVIKVIGRIKRSTANVLRKEFPWLKSRLPCIWTQNKFVSTVGAVALDVVKKYIEDQKGK